MKLFEILKKKDVGSIGIGAMIVFIAMVLVAGIAASVLVQTANRLESQAMTTGEQTTAEVATGLRVVDIEGHKTTRNVQYNYTTGLIWNISGRHDCHNADGDNFSVPWSSAQPYFEDFHYSRLHNMSITVAPRAGSMDIDLAQSVIEISNSTVKCLLTYDSNSYIGAVETDGVFGTTGAFIFLGPDDFGLIEIEDADNSVSSTTPVINRGDKVMLTVNLTVCFRGLPERTDVWGQVIPEDGSSGIFAFRTPASLSDTVYDLY